MTEPGVPPALFGAPPVDSRPASSGLASSGPASSGLASIGAASSGAAGPIPAARAQAEPLAVRMRPRTLDELAGQQHLLGAGSPLRRLVEGDHAMSVLLWGPPGTGKTTIARIVSTATDRRFVELSAVTAGVREVRAAIEAARGELARHGTETVLFVDEVHRFSKTQQDALLPSVENRWVTLVAATTENPFFSVVAPLLSRSLLLTLTPLTDDDVREVVRSALSDRLRGVGAALDTAVGLTPEAEDTLVRLAGGDARRALTYLEAAAATATGRGLPEVDVEVLATAVNRAAVRYDRAGDQHFDVASAFIKSIRGSDADAALHWLARMLEAGEDPRFVARRLMISAAEDVGLADPAALPLAAAAATAVATLGMPEGRIVLAEVTVALALAPKSNAVITAIDAAVADVRNGLIGNVPAGLRDAHYRGASTLGHGLDYAYSHDDPRGVVAQQYAPDAVAHRRYYRPTSRGAEADYGRRWAALRAIVRGTADRPGRGT